MTETTKVVHLRAAPYDVYIGRAMPRQRLKGSPLANPYVIGRDGTREEVLASYRAWLMGRPDLLALVPALKGKTLGCWCKPLACHGDLLAQLADGRQEDE
jgi:hypothetical protein